MDLRKKVISGPSLSGALSLKIRGLLGGHSGMFIDKERGNSNKLIARVLYRVRLAGYTFGLVSMQGGSKDNAIPRECDVVISCGKDDEEGILKTVRAVESEISSELAASDPDFRIDAEPMSAADRMITAECTKDIISLLYLLPNGVAAMNMEMKNLVETSDNVGVVRIDEDGAWIRISLRSADESRLNELRDRVELTASLFGAYSEESGRYPGMRYQAQSKFRDDYAKIMRDVWGRELRVLAGHAGGEGGYFADNLPGLEMVCLGPVISDVHCPDEKMEIESFIRVYDFLKEVLARI